jgi:hypothetical protein
VLAFAGLEAPEAPGEGDYLPTTLGKNELVSMGEKILASSTKERPGLLRQMPDAIFLVESMPSDVVQVLVRVAGYRLVPLPFAEAFSLAELNDTSTLTAQLEPGFIRSTVIPPYLYQVTPAVPGRGCPTLGTSLLLVAHRDVPRGAVHEMLKVIHESHLALVIHPQSPSGTSPEYRLHPGAVAYRDRDEPIVSRELLDVLVKLITLWVFISAACYTVSRYFQCDPMKRCVH